MKSRTSLVLMEQLIMVLIFALAAAMCLRIFAASEQLSKKNEALSQAVYLAQNAAELMKHSGGDQEAVLGEVEQYMQVIPQPSERGWAYRLEITAKDSGTEGLGKALIQVFGREKDKTEELLFELSVAWQEEK